MTRTRKTTDLTPWDLVAIEELIQEELDNPRKYIHKDSLEFLKSKLQSSDGTGRLNLRRPRAVVTKTKPGLKHGQAIVDKLFG